LLLWLLGLAQWAGALVEVSRRLAVGSTVALNWRQFTAIVPLEEVAAPEAKEPLPVEALAARLVRDVTEGATGKGGYLVTGDLDSRLFKNDARFRDPTNDVSSLSKYQKAVSILWDTQIGQRVTLLSGPIVNGRSVTATVHVSPGVIKLLPWRPTIRAFDTTLTWLIGDDGLVQDQSQIWSISAADALIQTFTFF